MGDASRRREKRRSPSKTDVGKEPMTNEELRKLEKEKAARKRGRGSRAWSPSPEVNRFELRAFSPERRKEEAEKRAAAEAIVRAKEELQSDDENAGGVAELT